MPADTTCPAGWRARKEGGYTRSVYEPGYAYYLASTLRPVGAEGSMWELKVEAWYRLTEGDHHVDVHVAQGGVPELASEATLQMASWHAAWALGWRPEVR